MTTPLTLESCNAMEVDLINESKFKEKSLLLTEGTGYQGLGESSLDSEVLSCWSQLPLNEPKLRRSQGSESREIPMSWQKPEERFCMSPPQKKGEFLIPILKESGTRPSDDLPFEYGIVCPNCSFTGQLEEFQFIFE